MSNLPSTFPTDLGISSRVGLTRGVGRYESGLGSFAEAEMHYRQHRILRDLAARRQVSRSRSVRSARSERFGHEVLSRWTTWLPSVPLLHRSSPAQPSSSACGN